MNRGYAGFYSNHYLRSSYEYAYARYLDYHSISWGYEEVTFNIGYKNYKPDFFLYDKDHKLKKIVEIKSRNKKAKSEAKKALCAIKELYYFDCELLSYEELLELYKSMPFSLNSIITEWTNSADTTINKAAFGKLNGHFNMKHSQHAKKLIGEHTKQLWATDTPVRQKMIEGLRKSGMKKGYLKISREKRVCEKCMNEFEVIATSLQRFCSRSCSGKDAIRNATLRYVEKRCFIHKKIKDHIIKWSIENKDLVSGTPLNKIKTTLSPLINEIKERYGVKDIRIISKAVFGQNRGRKELIMFMKMMCNEKLC